MRLVQVQVSQDPLGYASPCPQEWGQRLGFLLGHGNPWLTLPEALLPTVSLRERASTSLHHAAPRGPDNALRSYTPDAKPEGTCNIWSSHMPPSSPASRPPAPTPATGLGVSVTPSADTLVEKFRTVHAGLVPTFPAHHRLILNHFYELLGHGEKTLDLKEGGEEM